MFKLLVFDTVKAFLTTCFKALLMKALLVSTDQCHLHPVMPPWQVTSPRTTLLNSKKENQGKLKTWIYKLYQCCISHVLYFYQAKVISC